MTAANASVNIDLDSSDSTSCGAAARNVKSDSDRSRGPSRRLSDSARSCSCLGPSYDGNGGTEGIYKREGLHAHSADAITRCKSGSSGDANRVGGKGREEPVKRRREEMYL